MQCRIKFSGELDINKIKCEDDIPDNSNHIRNENINYGSRLLAKDENSGNYHITQGMSRSIKFRSINNIYKVFRIKLLFIYVMYLKQVSNIIQQ